MNELEFLARILLCLAFGAILGLETETRTGDKVPTSAKAEKERLGGLRTYVILTLFGGLAGILFAQGYPVFAYLMFISIAVVVLAAYILHVQYRQAFGLTTEISVLTAVLISFATTADIVPLQILLVIALVLALILSQKRGIGALINRVGHHEVEDVVKFLIIVFVIWPFLPDKTFYLTDLPNSQAIITSLNMPAELVQSLALANPYRLWLYVLLISGISLFGYFVGKFLGMRRAQAITAAFGGLVSSTSATVAFAHQAKHKSEVILQRLAGLALLANSTSFISLAVIAASINGFLAIIGEINWALMLSSLVIALIFFLRPHKENKIEYNVKYQPFSVGPAIKFILLLSVLRILVQLINYYFGDAGFILATSLSGLVGVDVATINIGETWAAGGITASLAAVTFFSTNIVNYAAKTAYGYLQGNKWFARWLGIGLAISATSALLVVIL